MLVNRNKEKRNNRNSQGDPSLTDNIQSMRNWVRKIEQTTNSVSARLCAVEKRLSRRTTESDDFFMGVTPDKMKNANTSKKKQQTRKKKNVETIANFVDAEFASIQEDLTNHENNMKILKETVDGLSDTVGKMKEDLHKIQLAASSQLDETYSRLKTIEQKQPLIMRLGTFEIPIEFTGLIGGFLSFLIALLVLLNKKEIILSPVFLCLVGILLIGSALLKTIRRRTQRKIQSVESPFFPIESEISASETSSSHFKG